MSDILDEIAERVVDVGAQVVELRQEWERSRAFLADLEASIHERPGAADISEATFRPTVWEDPTNAQNPDTAFCNQTKHSASFKEKSSSGEDNFVETVHAKGHEHQAARSSVYARQCSVSHIQMKFDSCFDHEIVTLISDDSLSANLLQPGAPMMPRPPPLQRAASLRQRGPAPIQRARTLRALTLDSSPSNSEPLSVHNLNAWRAELAPTTPTAPQVSSSVNAAHSDNLNAFKSVRRFSMDHEQLRVLPALLPTALGGPPQRRVSIGSFHDTTTTRPAGPGGLLSFRRMSSHNCNVTPAWGGSSTSTPGISSFANNTTERAVISGSCGGGTDPGNGGDTVHEPFTDTKLKPQLPLGGCPSLNELPPLYHHLGRRVAASDTAPRLTANPVTSPRPAVPFSTATILRLRSVTSFGATTSVGTSSGVSSPAASTALSGPVEGPDDGDSDACFTPSVRPSQLRAAVGHRRSGPWEVQQQGGESVGSDFSTSPGEGAQRLSSWRSVSMPRSQAYSLTDDPAPLSSTPPQQQVQAQHQPLPLEQSHVADEGCSSPHVFASGSPQASFRTKSVSSLRLIPIPEALGVSAPVFARSTIGQLPDSPGKVHGGQRLSGSGVAAAAATSAGGVRAGSIGRFSRRAVTDLFGRA